VPSSLSRILGDCYHRRVTEQSDATRKIPVIVGPTASGKSELGIKLALEIGGEIVNLDSIQVYRGIYVATSKTPLDERRGVPHHLIDIAEPTENFTAGRYGSVAETAIHEIESRNKAAVLVGGTGFYLRALVKPLFESPATDADLRARLIRLRESRGPQHLHRILERLDPASARRISPRDWSRTMRALEYRLQTRGRISEAQTNMPEPPGLSRRIRIIALNPPRAELYERINRRADSMSEGLIDEVRTLIRAGVPSTAKAFGAHGYRRVIEYLEGKRSREDALEQMKIDTRHYAKRQLSWWRSWPGVKWINRFGEDDESLKEALEILAADDLLD
jgi:tRNA dimethylallyltransferase